jgi:hypothetical protein
LIRAHSITGFLLTAGTAGAQTIIPVDAGFPAPYGFSSQGSWKCSDPAGWGMLKVGKASNDHNRPSGSLVSTWTKIMETDQDLVGNYLVAYDRDNHEFIMIDADEPVYAAYSTDGWRCRELTLTSDETQRMQRHRLVYKIEGRYQFIVIFALWEAQAGLRFPAPHAIG